MIVYGRRNYFKRKSFHRRAPCGNCRRDVFLHSYSTTRCFQIARLPLFPVGQRRIIDHCPSCDHATQQPLRQWNRARRHELGQALEAMREQPADPAATWRALDLATRLGAIDEFHEIVAHCATCHLENPNVLIELGNSFHRFGLAAEGDEAYRRSLAIRDHPGVARHLAYHAASPPMTPPSPPRPVPEILPLALTPAILLIALALTIHAAYFGTPRHVYLLNGIGRPYEVVVNGERHRLDPAAPFRLPAGDRTWSIHPGDGAPPFEPYDEKLRAPLFNRGRGRRVVVFNPDLAALILWEQATYRSPVALASGAAAAGNRSFYTGERLYIFEDIDAPFAELPNELSEAPSPDFASLRGIRQVTRFSPNDNAFAILENGQRGTAIEYTRHGLRHHPENEDFLTLLTALSEPGQTLAFLETRLADRPVLVEWHRYYQELAARYRPAQDILTTYRRAVISEPDNRDLAYLLGRLIEKPAEARAVLAKATEPPNPSPHAFHALAFHHMNRGSFQEALETERKALRLLPGKPRFLALEEEMLLATGSYYELIKRRRSAFASAESDRKAALALAFVLALSGEIDEARKVMNRHLERTAGPASKDNHTAALFEAILAEGTRDLDSFSRASALVQWGDWPYCAAVANRDLVRAGQLLRERRSQSWREHLLLYTIAESDGHDEVARERLEDAIGFLRDAGPRESSAAAWFEKNAIAPGLEEVFQLRSWPADARIMLAALGVRFPRMQSVYFKAANKMNYDPAFPGTILHDLLNGPSGRVTKGE